MARQIARRKGSRLVLQWERRSRRTGSRDDMAPSGGPGSARDAEAAKSEICGWQSEAKQTEGRPDRAGQHDGRPIGG